MPTLGQFLRTSREKRGLSLREVARRAELSPTLLSFLEADSLVSKSSKKKKQPEIPVAEETLNALADVLGVRPISLMALAGKMPQELKDIVLSHLEEFEELLKQFKDVPRTKVAEFSRQVRNGKW
jgi:transcriptional regulator with XRE-family HTH domain